MAPASFARWTKLHAGDVIASLERDVFPSIGRYALAAIDSPTVLRVLRTVERRGSFETARRIRQRISAVFAFAMSEGVADADPAAIVRKALAPQLGQGRQPALLDLDDARELVARVEALDADIVTKLASRFLALTAVRMAALRGAEWSEFEDIDWIGDAIGPRRPLWRVPAARMKLTATKKANAINAHPVPLSREAVDLLLSMRSADGKGGASSQPGAA